MTICTFWRPESEISKEINKIDDFQRVSIGFKGLAARPSFKILQILQKTSKFLKIPHNFLEISRHFSKFLKISQNFLEILENLPRPPETPGPGPARARGNLPGGEDPSKKISKIEKMKTAGLGYLELSDFENNKNF